MAQSVRIQTTPDGSLLAGSPITYKISKQGVVIQESVKHASLIAEWDICLDLQTYEFRARRESPEHESCTVAYSMTYEFVQDISWHKDKFLRSVFPVVVKEFNLAAVFLSKAEEAFLLEAFLGNHPSYDFG